ncbi:hypothetical protein AVEN_238684-1 [Araneus ventricosus]|uniref:Uncharacterized protein n=1 Tax=Araneus ventricosus TaxID=182803 RepID=A0A4Y2BVV4_ARAVE|nr:hypothetical protein AVEN_238684-1 [Araneus ventricosus]
MQVGNDNNSREFLPVQKGSFRIQPVMMRISVSNALVSENSKFRKIVCPQCGDCHLLCQCSQIQRLAVEKRWNLVREKRLCINCLRPNHFVSKCLFTGHCKICQNKHISILHEEEKKHADESAFERRKNLSITVSREMGSVDPDQKPGLLSECKSKDSGCFCKRANDSNMQVLLSTALINVRTRSADSVA